MRARDELVGAVDQRGNIVRPQRARDGMRRRSRLAGAKLRAVPWRVVRPVAEFSQASGSDHHLTGVNATRCERLNGCARELCGRRRRQRQKCESRQLRDAIEHRDAKHRIRLRECSSVVKQHRAQSHEGVVDIADVRLLRLLVARNRADQVFPQRRRRDRDAGKADVAHPLRNTVQGCAPRPNHEHPLVLPNEGANRVDDGLGASGARQCAHHERVARGDLRDHVLLLRVGVEQQSVSLRRAKVGGQRLRLGEALVDAPPCGGVSGKGIENRVVEVVSVAGERRCDIREARNHEARRDLEPLEVRGQPAQAIDDGVWLEGAFIIGERDESLGVESNAELVVEGAGEFGVEKGSAAQLDLKVTAVTTNGERPKQHGRAKRFFAAAGVHSVPLGDADSEVNCIDAACARQL